MQYLALLSGTATGEMPPPAVMEGIMELGGQAAASGALVTQSGLQPSRSGARVVLQGGEIDVLDGPFAETKELLSYAIYDCRSLEEAVEWSRRFMALHQEHWAGWEGDVRVLPLFVPPAQGDY